MHPIDVSEYFFKRFEALHNIFQGKKSVFGEVQNWWYRVESQNRGALHIHMILWIKEGTIPDNVIVAELSRGNDEDCQHLTELVQKFQLHTCRPNRCFHTTSGKVITRCKYGFPQKYGIKMALTKIVSDLNTKEQNKKIDTLFLTTLMLFKCGVHIFV